MNQKSFGQQSSRQSQQDINQAPSAGRDATAINPPAYGMDSIDQGLQRATSGPGLARGKPAIRAGRGLYANPQEEKGRTKLFERRAENYPVRQLRQSFSSARQVIQRKEGDVHRGVVAKKPSAETLAIKVSGAVEAWFEIPASQTLTEGQQVEFTEGAALAVTNLRVVPPVPVSTATPTVTTPVSASPVPKSGSAAAPQVGLSEMKSSTPTRTFGQEMGALGKANAGGRYHYHYGINSQHSDAKMPYGDLGIRAEAMRKHGGTVGEFTFKPALYKGSNGYDFKLLMFNHYFNQSVTPAEKHKAKYAGAVENKATGQVTKHFAARGASPLAPTTMGRRFSKASLVYAVMQGGNIHFHLEGMGSPTVVTELVGKTGTFKDAVTSSELRYVHRFWDRGFSIYLPEGFWSKGAPDSDDESDTPPKLVEDKSFKGFKDRTSFYRKEADKFVTVAPPW